MLDLVGVVEYELLEGADPVEYESREVLIRLSFVRVIELFVGM